MSQLELSDFGLFGAIQEAVKLRLEQSEQLTGISVITEMTGDLDAKVRKAVNMQGIVIEVMTPTASAVVANIATAIVFEKIPVVVQVTERPIINRGATGTRKPGLLVVQYVLALLHNYIPSGMNSIVIDDPPFADAPLPEGVPDEYRMWNVNFWTSGDFSL